MELYQRNLAKAFDVGVPLSLEVLNAAGNVSVRGAQEQRAEVTATIEVYADSPAEADAEVERVAEGISYDETDGLIIRSPGARSSGIYVSFHPFDISLSGQPRLRISYDIRVPRETQAELAVGSGALAVSGIAGPLEARVANGPANIEEVEQAVEVNVSNGKLALKRCGADVEARVANGAVDASQVHGSLQVSAANGPVTVEEVRGRLQVRGVNGRIKYKGSIAGDFDLHLTNGGIDLELPSGSRFEVDAEAKHGSVHSDFAVKELPGDGTRGPRLYLRTLNGWINIGEIRLEEPVSAAPSPPQWGAPQAAF